MKKYILLFAIILAGQAQAQWGTPERFFKRSGSTVTQRVTTDTIQVTQFRVGSSTTAGFVLVADARGVLTLQSVTSSSAGAVKATDGVVLSSDSLRLLLATGSKLQIVTGAGAVDSLSLDATANIDWTGTHTFDDFIQKADVLDFLAGGLGGGTDTTAYDVPSKLVAAGDSLQIDFAVSQRFTSLDSVVVYTTTIGTSGDSMAVSVEFKKIAEGGSVSAAFNAAQVDTLDMGSGATLTVFRFNTFGSLATGAGEIVGLVRRNSLAANDMTETGIIRRVLLYGVGLR